MKAQISACGALFLSLLAQPAWADARDDVLLTVQRCRALTEARSWLDCYYGAAQPMRSQLGLPPAPLSQQQSVPPASAYTPPPEPAMAAARPQNRDVFDKLFSAGPTPVVTGIAMKDYRFDPRGAFTVVLANGQVWREDPREHPFAGWHDRPAGYIVTITPEGRGYRMRIVGDQNSYAVQRVS